jgi:hypothetical protein
MYCNLKFGNGSPIFTICYTVEKFYMNQHKALGISTKFFTWTFNGDDTVLTISVIEFFFFKIITDM